MANWASVGARGKKGTGTKPGALGNGWSVRGAQFPRDLPLRVLLFAPQVQVLGELNLNIPQGFIGLIKG